MDDGDDGGGNGRALAIREGMPQSDRIQEMLRNINQQIGGGSGKGGEEGEDITQGRCVLRYLNGLNGLGYGVQSIDPTTYQSAA